MLDAKIARYVAVGILGAVIEATAFSCLVAEGMGIGASNAIAFHLAFVTCYFLHHKYTHRKDFSGTAVLAFRFAKYAALMYGQLLLGYFLLRTLMVEVGFTPAVSKVLQIAVVTPLGYLVQKGVVFK